MENSNGRQPGRREGGAADGGAASSAPPTSDPDTAPGSELDTILAELASIMDEIGDADSLFVSGSAVTGEWSASASREGWRFFSDLDIGVVRDPRNDSYEANLNQRIESRMRELAVVRDWRRPPRINIAFYTTDDLGRQAAKPGTFEMIDKGRVVWGASIHDRFPDLAVEDLTWEEAIRLLGNRVLELFSAPPGDSIELEDFYRVSKLHCDFATALLVPDGAYVSGYANRARQLREVYSDRTLSPKLARRIDVILDDIDFWTRFRTQPSEELLAERYPAILEQEEVRGVLGGVWCEARRSLEACLEALLPHRLLNADGRPSPSSMSRSSGWGSFRHRIREWRWLANRDPRLAGLIWRRGLSVAFRLSPVEITYLIGFVLFLRNVDGLPPCYRDDDLVESLERWYPLPHQQWTTGESIREDVVRLWRYWLPRI